MTCSSIHGQTQNVWLNVTYPATIAFITTIPNNTLNADYRTQKASLISRGTKPKHTSS